MHSKLSLSSRAIIIVAVLVVSTALLFCFALSKSASADEFTELYWPNITDNSGGGYGDYLHYDWSITDVHPMYGEYNVVWTSFVWQQFADEADRDAGTNVVAEEAYDPDSGYPCSSLLYDSSYYYRAIITVDPSYIIDYAVFTTIEYGYWYNDTIDGVSCIVFCYTPSLAIDIQDLTIDGYYDILAPLHFDFYLFGYDEYWSTVYFDNTAFVWEQFSSFADMEADNPMDTDIYDPESGETESHILADIGYYYRATIQIDALSYTLDTSADISPGDFDTVELTLEEDVYTLVCTMCIDMSDTEPVRNLTISDESYGAYEGMLHYKYKIQELTSSSSNDLYTEQWRWQQFATEEDMLAGTNPIAEEAYDWEIASDTTAIPYESGYYYRALILPDPYNYNLDCISTITVPTGCAITTQVGRATYIVWYLTPDTNYVLGNLTRIEEVKLAIPSMTSGTPITADFVEVADGEPYTIVADSLAVYSTADLLENDLVAACGSYQRGHAYRYDLTLEASTDHFFGIESIAVIAAGYERAATIRGAGNRIQISFFIDHTNKLGTRVPDFHIDEFYSPYVHSIVPAYFVATPDTAGVRIASITWFDRIDRTPLVFPNTFLPDKEYICEVVLEAEDGYYLNPITNVHLYRDSFPLKYRARLEDGVLVEERFVEIHLFTIPHEAEGEIHIDPPNNGMVHYQDMIIPDEDDRSKDYFVDYERPFPDWYSWSHPDYEIVNEIEAITYTAEGIDAYNTSIGYFMYNFYPGLMAFYDFHSEDSLVSTRFRLIHDEQPAVSDLTTVTVGGAPAYVFGEWVSVFSDAYGNPIPMEVTNRVDISIPTPVADEIASAQITSGDAQLVYLSGYGQYAAELPYANEHYENSLIGYVAGQTALLTIRIAPGANKVFQKKTTRLFINGQEYDYTLTNNICHAGLIELTIAFDNLAEVPDGCELLPTLEITDLVPPTLGERIGFDYSLNVEDGRIMTNAMEWQNTTLHAVYTPDMLIHVIPRCTEGDYEVEFRFVSADPTLIINSLTQVSLNGEPVDIHQYDPFTGEHTVRKRYSLAAATEPEDPGTPEEPEDPIGEEPIGGEPEDPGTPEVPEDPIGGEPDDPGTPEEPEDPIGEEPIGGEPEDPGTPEVPIGEDPLVPEDPGTPEEPEDPIGGEPIGGDPLDPGAPEDPLDPGTPIDPDDPGTPGGDPLDPSEDTPIFSPDEPYVPIEPDTPVDPIDLENPIDAVIPPIIIPAPIHTHEDGESCIACDRIRNIVRITLAVLFVLFAVLFVAYLVGKWRDKDEQQAMASAHPKHRRTQP